MPSITSLSRFLSFSHFCRQRDLLQVHKTAHHVQSIIAHVYLSQVPRYALTPDAPHVTVSFVRLWIDNEASAISHFIHFAPCGLTKMAPLLNPSKVLITDKIDQVCKIVLEQHGLEVTLKPGMPKDDLLKEIKVCLGFLALC